MSLPPLPDDYRTMLDRYVLAAQQTLGDALTALYLYGSAVSGDFIAGKSDLDLVAILNDEPSDAQRGTLSTMHTALAAQTPLFDSKFEVFYMPLHALRAYNPSHPPRPRWNAGRFYDCWQGHDWILHRKQLRDHGIPLLGEKPHDLIDPVSPQDIQRGVAQWIVDSLAPYLGDSARVRDPYFQTYLILTLCRALYTLETGHGIAKSAAGEYAKKHWPEKSEAINAAIAYFDGTEMHHFDDAMDLLARMTDRAKHILSTPSS